MTFAEANIVHVADTFWNGIYPFIDYSTGGSIDGMIAASDANLAATAEDTIIIAGHGKAGQHQSRAQAISRHACRYSRQRRRPEEAGTVARRDGRGKADRAFDAKFGNFVIDPGFFTRLVYQGV